MTSGAGGAVEVAIVGGGIIGCALGYELTRKGAAVAIVERGSLAREASWASAGIISPPSAANTSPVHTELTTRSLSAYPWLIAALQEETGLDVGYRQWGELLIAPTEADAVRLRNVLSWHESLGVDSEWVEPDELRDLEPALPEGLDGAVLVNDAGSVIVHRLTVALATAAAQRGARLIEYTPAVGIDLDGQRAVGVRLPHEVLAANTVVLAAGAWTNRFGVELGQPLPTVPVKGQMLSIVNPPIRPQHIIGGAGGYLVPRTDGSIAVGATEEQAGFDKRVTPAGVRELIGLIEALSPGLLEGEIAATWAGLRPGTIDREPIIGQVPGHEHLWVATGHFRAGVQLAIGTAEVMAASIVAGTPDPILDPISPARFTSLT